MCELHTPLVLGNESIGHVVAQAVQSLGTDISVGAVFASYQESKALIVFGVFVVVLKRLPLLVVS